MTRTFKEVMAEYKPLGRKTLGEITQAEFDRAQELTVEAFAAIKSEVTQEQELALAVEPLDWSVIEEIEANLAKIKEARTHATATEPGTG